MCYHTILTIISLIFTIQINIGGTFSTKPCNNKDLFGLGIHALCESNSKLSVSCLKNPNKAYLSCQSGYYPDNENITSQQILECKENGKWSDEPIKCIPDCIPFSNEMKLLKKEDIQFPTSYAEIVRKERIENEENIYPGLIVHPRKIISKCNFLKKNEWAQHFLLRIYLSESKVKEIQHLNILHKFMHNNEEFCEFYLSDYIAYNENIKESCLFSEIQDKLNIEDRDKFSPGYNKKCYIPDGVNGNGIEIRCFNNKYTDRIETISNDGKYIFVGGISRYEPDQCNENADEILIRCRLGYENSKLIDKNSISYCVRQEWEHHHTEITNCDRICGTINSTQNQSENGVLAAPWHVSILTNNTNMENRLEEICAGSIIHTNIVISAAHCFYNETAQELNHPSNYLIMTGNSKLNSNEENYNSVKRIRIPLNYEFKTNQNNIALLILQNHLEFNSYIKPICIEWLSYKDYKINENALGLYTVQMQSELNSTDTTTIQHLTLSNIECQERLKSNPELKITNDKFCAINKNNLTVCEGGEEVGGGRGGGGGFALKRGAQYAGYYFLAGIQNVLRTEKKCSNELISVFTNIQFHQDFIKSVIEETRGHGLFQRKDYQASSISYMPIE